MDKPIRIVVVGAAGRATWGIPAIQATGRFEIVAMVDPVRARAQLLADEFNLAGIPLFERFGSCLEQISFDAAAIFTPDGTHADLVVPALERGKWVFVEKPLDISADRVATIVEADRRAGGRTFVGFNLRYAPVYAAVHELIRAGTLGRVLTIQADEFYDGGRTYFRRWNRLQRFGGGLWITKACHDFDLLYWMAGDMPVSVQAFSDLSYYGPRPEAAMYCRECNLRSDCFDRYDLFVSSDGLIGRLNNATEQATGHKPDLCVYNSDKDTFDHGMATVRFANGVLATYTVNVVAGFTNRRMRVAGTRAAVDADLSAGRVTIFHRDPSRIEEISVETNAAHGGADGHVFPAFADFVQGRAARFVAPAEAAVAISLGQAAQVSCDSGKIIHLNASV